MSDFPQNAEIRPRRRWCGWPNKKLVLNYGMLRDREGFRLDLVLATNRPARGG
jgi:hypothetical protein